MKAADWFGRTLFLILSGLATFAILASVQSASRLPKGWQADRAAPQSASGPAVDPGSSSGGAGRTADLHPPRPAPSETTAASALAEAALVPVPAANDDALAKWLEALTYAILALAGFAAAALIVLLRISASLARIAAK